MFCQYLSDLFSDCVSPVTHHKADIQTYIEEQDNYGYTPLLGAIKAGDLEFIKYLISSGANINAENKQQDNALHIATLHYPSSKNGLTIIKYLIETCKAQSLLDKQNKNGETPLMIAIWRDYTEVAKYFIAKGADLKLTNKKQQTALQIAITMKNYEPIKLIISKHPSSIDYKASYASEILLMALKNSDKETVNELLEKGVDPNNVTAK